MKKKKEQRQSEASAPRKHHDETLVIKIEAPPEDSLCFFVVATTALAAQPLEAYKSGRVPGFTYQALNADNLRAGIYRIDPAVSKLTKAAFEEDRCRLHEKVEATHFGCAFPIRSSTELCSGCNEVFVTISESPDEQLVVAAAVLRDAEGHFAGFAQPIALDSLVDSERLIEKYFTENAAKAPTGHTWNYTPSNN
jgi:hypothetical protein